MWAQGKKQKKMRSEKAPAGMLLLGSGAWAEPLIFFGGHSHRPGTGMSHQSSPGTGMRLPAPASSGMGFCHSHVPASGTGNQELLGTPRSAKAWSLNRRGQAISLLYTRLDLVESSGLSLSDGSA